MNYNSVQEILDAGITNMEVIRNNSRNDDGNDTLIGVDWFTFNNIVAKNITVSGNSWLGFGATSEQLRVNRRDAASYFIYREEGTLFEYYKFLKIRWSGYSYYGQTGDSYKQEYDVILWDTGAISLHMTKIPTTNNDGVYSLSDSTSYSYTVSVDSPDVTFIYSDGTFSVVNSIIELLPPFDVRWLVRANELLYTTKNNILEQVSGTMLNAECFQTNGSESPPTWELIESLVDPDILCWYDSDEFKPTTKATMTATPFSQSIISNKVDLTHESITGIENATADCDGELIFAVSFDDKQTWKAWNGEVWSNLSGEFSGMSKETFESITFDQWGLLYAGATSMYLRVTLVDASQIIRKITIDFAN